MEELEKPAVESTPVDPGCLPAWKMDEMPAPVPLQGGGLKTLLALVGPGLVMIGSTIGTGEWVTGAAVADLYRGALLWVAPVAILSQVILNTEAMRYTLVTGEPIFTGFMRSRPGPRFWLIWYLLLDSLSWLPALAGLSAQILIFTFNGQQSPDPGFSRLVSSIILLVCGLLLCFGGKIYNTLEVVLGGKVIFVLIYMLFVTIAFVPFSVWTEVVGGMLNPFNVPEGVNWSLVGAVAGFAGIGGMGNILASNYVREKGWGMGAKVGAIGSAFGGHEIKLANLGTMAHPTQEAASRFKNWWKVIQRDQFGLWLIGSIVGMLLPCLLGAAYIKENYFGKAGDFKAAVTLAQDFGAAKGPIFLILTLICGFIIMFPGQFSSMDRIARLWCDAIWSGSRRARAAQPHKVKHLYYSLVGLYVLIGILVYGVGIFGGSPAKMMIFNANLANLAITSCLLHTLYVNLRFVPAQFRPTRLKQLGLCLAAVFYFGMFCLSATQTIERLKKEPLFSARPPAARARLG